MNHPYAYWIVKIKHNSSKFSNLEFAYSTCHISKVLIVEQREGNPNHLREFLKLSKPRFFNYQDYDRALFIDFLIQNKILHHSWIFYFQSKYKLSFFHYGFTLCGIILVQPLSSSQTFSLGFCKFSKIIVFLKKWLVFPQLLFFFSDFLLAWIIQWDYIIIENMLQQSFPLQKRLLKLSGGMT